ncbi:MAG: hypothetical protein ACTSP2_02930, partial [Alphaproteobacteria bacterium]
MRSNMTYQVAGHRPLRGRSTRSYRLRMAIRVVLVFFAVLVVVGMGIFAVLLTGPTEIGLVREQVIQTLRDGLGEGYRV